MTNHLLARIQKLEAFETSEAERALVRQVLTLNFVDSTGAVVEPTFARAMNYRGDPITFHRGATESADEFRARAYAEYAEADAADRHQPKIPARAIVFAGAP